ncbi:hypothetical protein PAPYR_10317 [Paratrimastix pyriformis]|uniref:Uncharacterized protein n=1 Tax=Paratrimastix pyriformis TaxID=342808 RepID=A0ABQ8U800_9EUKA|nr:hypothetical protein PAPYR_10317 [Paratrimastix pyriformis]
MDQPFFDEETKAHKFLFWVTSICVSLFVLAVVVVGVIFGIIAHWQLFMAVCLICVAYAVTFILVRWWRRRDIDPKVKFLIYMLIVVLLLSGISILVSTSYPGDQCANGQIYRRTDNKCFTPCASDQCMHPVTFECRGHTFPNCSDVFPQPPPKPAPEFALL